MADLQSAKRCKLDSSQSPKQGKFDSEGLRYYISPKKLASDLLIGLKRENSEGYEIDQLYFYHQILGTNPRVAMADVLNFLIGFLDHSLKLVAKSKSNFSRDFVLGKGEKKYAKPFSGTYGATLKYITLVKFIGYMRKEEREKSEDKDKKEKGKKSKRYVEKCMELLQEIERKFINDVILSCGVKIDESLEVIADNIRQQILCYCNLERLWGGGEKDLIDYTYMVDNKDGRVFGAHPFTTLYWDEYNLSLSEQNLEVSFPCKCDRSFSTLSLGRRCLLLEDLKKKYEHQDFGKDYNIIFPLGVLLIKTFIKKHNTYERNVCFRSLRAQIPGQRKAEAESVLDLDAIANQEEQQATSKEGTKIRLQIPGF